MSFAASPPSKCLQKCRKRLINKPVSKFDVLNLEYSMSLFSSVCFFASASSLFPCEPKIINEEGAKKEIGAAALYTITSRLVYFFVHK